jgi:HAD superfamily hydrolase (TIGR01484 family)
MDAVKVIAFDLDGTLAESKQVIPDEIATHLNRLLDNYVVAIITGGTLEQVQRQVVSKLSNPVGLEVFSCSGATYHIYGLDGLVQIYEHLIKEDDRREIQSQIESAARKLGHWVEVTHGNAFEFRGSQLTWSACGQLAAVDVKAGYDPTGEKRKAIISQLNLSNFDVRLGGMTSIDVSGKGRDKGYAVKVLTSSGYKLDDIVYFGDQFGPSGNDLPVKKAGVLCYQVNNWGDTLKWLADF